MFLSFETVLVSMPRKRLPRTPEQISKNPRVQRFAATDLESAFKKYYPKPKETTRALTVKQFNTICYMLGATDYTVLEIAERVSKLGEKISRRPVEKINKILKFRTSEEAKAIGKKSVKRKLSIQSDEVILKLLSKRGMFGGREDFVFSQSDVARLSKAGASRVNRLAQQVRTREDNLRVSKRREREKRKELAKLAPTKSGKSKTTKSPKKRKGSTVKPNMGAIIKYSVPIHLVALMYGISEAEARKKVGDYKKEHNLK